MGNKVVLYSGGLDSFCMAHAVKPDLLLYFDIGLPEQQEEMKAISKMSNLGTLSAPVFFDSRFRLAGTKLENEVLPFRNLYFIIAAFCFGSKIYLGKTASSRNLDKDPVFAAKALDVCKYISQNPAKNPKGLLVEDMEIILPFDLKTKSTFLGEFIDAGGNLDHLLMTRSCYKPYGQECGVCQSCIRKSIALVNNGIAIEGRFEANPMQFYAQQLQDVLTVGNPLVITELESVLNTFYYKSWAVTACP
jgi:7-cyano-7-deazaguanine synthase in queuosine biosynthesis